MTSKTVHKQERYLRDHGYDLSYRPGIRFNTGSETLGHFVGKCLAAYILHADGYTVDTEDLTNDNSSFLRLD